MRYLKLRTQQLVLDLPLEGADVWIRAAIQTVIKDDEYNTTQTVDRTSFIHRMLSEVFTDSVEVIDPFTGNVVTVSCAFLGAAMTELIKKWILEDNEGFINNEMGDIIKEI